MNSDSKQQGASQTGASPQPQERGIQKGETRTATWRWWIKIVMQPLIFAASILAVLAGIGVAQRFGWFRHDQVAVQTSEIASGQRYICPMMCTPPLEAPGRCPVCGMELVPLTNASGQDDPHAVHLAPAARRIANVQTVTVMQIPVSRTISSIGEVEYDESARKTLSAYVAGRIEQLFADYTGVTVMKGDELAILYAPKLYTSQVSYLLAKQSAETAQKATLPGTRQSAQELLATSRQRLIEMGMSAGQIENLDAAGEAGSRIALQAPISGTVTKKLVTEGQYLEEGQAIYELADLTTVWLMLRLFPDDAASVRYGQRVEADVDSLPGELFVGRVAFLDPNVDPQTRTVGVRVVIPNDDGRLRIGDYARARVNVPVDASGQTQIFDSELANKWISPRHPHIIADTPGKCPLCGVELVPASQFGFSSEPIDQGRALVVPRSAVLAAGDNSVVYVETQPGRFEIRRVVLGPVVGDQIVVHHGVTAGDHVAAKGNFLVDSAMQLTGNPSLIDPLRHASDPSIDAKAAQNLAGLSPEDRALAEKQRICPVTGAALGSMGVPLKISLDDRPVFVCCQACENQLKAEPARFLARLDSAASASVAEDNQKAIALALSKLPAEDKAAAERQRNCPVADSALGSMGVPPKVFVDGQVVFICCEGCRESLLANPSKYLTKLSEAHDGESQDDAPPLPTGPPKQIDPDLPPLPSGPPRKLVPPGETNKGPSSENPPGAGGMSS